VCVVRQAVRAAPAVGDVLPVDLSPERTPGAKPGAERGEAGGGVVSDRERLLWQAISRGLKLIVSAIDSYLKEPAKQSR
jgi:hypothetical protein